MKWQIHENTKKLIENLSDNQVVNLLKQKWVDTMISNQRAIFNEITSSFTKKVTRLENKYKVTFEEIESQLSESSSAICDLLSELKGNDYDEKAISELDMLLRGK